MGGRQRDVRGGVQSWISLIASLDEHRLSTLSFSLVLSLLFLPPRLPFFLLPSPSLDLFVSPRGVQQPDSRVRAARGGAREGRRWSQRTTLCYVTVVAGTRAT